MARAKKVKQGPPTAEEQIAMHRSLAQRIDEQEVEVKEAKEILTEKRNALRESQRELREMCLANEPLFGGGEEDDPE